MLYTRLTMIVYNHIMYKYTIYLRSVIVECTWVKIFCFYFFIFLCIFSRTFDNHTIL